MYDILLAGLVAHIIADWFLQNDWIARNKATLSHPAGYIHAAIHGIALFACWSAIGLAFPLVLKTSIFVASIHWLIDLRFLLAGWRKLFRQTIEGPASLHVAIWQDQMAHVLILIMAALYLTN